MASDGVYQSQVRSAIAERDVCALLFDSPRSRFEVAGFVVGDGNRKPRLVRSRRRRCQGTVRRFLGAPSQAV